MLIHNQHLGCLAKEALPSLGTTAWPSLHFWFKLLPSHLHYLFISEGTDIALGLLARSYCSTTKLRTKKYQLNSTGQYLSFLKFSGGSQGCTRGMELSTPTLSVDCGFHLEPVFKLRARIKWQWALPTSGHQCPRQQKVQHDCCHYQVCFNYCYYQQLGKGCKAATLQRQKAEQGSRNYCSNCKYFAICRVTGIK